MNSGFYTIRASTNRLIILAAASLLLLAAGDVSQAVITAGPEISDNVLAPVSAQEAVASAAALAATTPEDIAAAYAAGTAGEAPVAPSAAERAPSLAHLVATIDASVAEDDREHKCLATAVYFEARGEPMEGQLAVAQTIINRVESGRYPSTVCGVINQPKQFSYDRSRSPRAGADWETAQDIARIAMDDMWQEVAPKAISFHARRVSPNWSGKTRVAAIGNHIFYR